MSMEKALEREFVKLPKEWREAVQRAFKDASVGLHDEAESTMWAFAEQADAWCQRRNGAGDYSVAPVWQFLIFELIHEWNSWFTCDEPPEEEGECPRCQAAYDRQQSAIQWLVCQMMQQAHAAELEAVTA